MDRAYASGAAGTPPAVPLTPAIGYPQSANPGLGAPATKPGPYWYYMITEEIHAVIVAAGIAPDHGDLGQLAQAIAGLVAAGVANVGYLNVSQTWLKGQRGTIVALVDDVTITPDLAAGNNFAVTLAGNRTLANPANLSVGQSGVIAVTQDATGSRTLAFGSYYKFAGGNAPVLTATAGAIDHLYYYVESATRILVSAAKDIK